MNSDPNRPWFRGTNKNPETTCIEGAKDPCNGIAACDEIANKIWNHLNTTTDGTVLIQSLFNVQQSMAQLCHQFITLLLNYFWRVENKSPQPQEVLMVTKKSFIAFINSSVFDPGQVESEIIQKDPNWWPKYKESLYRSFEMMVEYTLAVMIKNGEIKQQPGGNKLKRFKNTKKHIKKGIKKSNKKSIRNKGKKKHKK